MTIEKLKSGSYRIKQMSEGKMYRVTVDHKPTNKEAVELLAKAMGTDANIPKSSFQGACRSYVDSKSHVLSPSTIVGYESLIRRISPDFMQKPLTQISIREVQAEVNRYAVGHNPKSVANLAHFIQAVLKFNGIELSSPKLPQKIKKDSYIPTQEDVQRILDMARDTRYEVPFTLAAFGLRRSEILGVTADKVNGNTLTIDTAIVQDTTKAWVDKTTKTEDSTRTIVIPEHIASLIIEQGKAYTGSAKMLNQTLNRFQEKLGIPHFSLHKMRHFYASFLHDKGFSDAQIQEMGGWSTDTVMKSIYRHALELEKAKSEACTDLSSLINHT